MLFFTWPYVDVLVVFALQSSVYVWVFSRFKHILAMLVRNKLYNTIQYNTNFIDTP